MNISQRLRTCAKHTGLDAVIELLQEAADEIDALQARAQVQGEPSWWMRETDEGAEWTDTAPLVLSGWTSLYTNPQPAQATQAEVTDAAIDAATRHIYHNGRPTSKEYRVGIARAILALRPERAPMTPEQRHEIICRYDEGKTYSDLVGIILATEAKHGITAQAKKGDE